MASIHWCVALSVAVVFATSGLAKLRSRRFVADLANYRLLPVAAVLPIAAATPWAELVVAALAVSLPNDRVALWAAAGLLVIFAAAMAINLARGRVISCGCRGTDKPVSWKLVATNLMLAAAALVVSTRSSNPTEMTTRQAATVAGCVVMAGLALRLTQHAGELRAVLATHPH